jgi:hypothetical protein
MFHAVLIIWNPAIQVNSKWGAIKSRDAVAPKCPVRPVSG